jgi:hypothetical protein
VVDVQDIYHLLVIVDAIPDAVFPSSRSILSFERRAKRCADAIRAVCQDPVDEF